MAKFFVIFVFLSGINVSFAKDSWDCNFKKELYETEIQMLKNDLKMERRFNKNLVNELNKIRLDYVQALEGAEYKTITIKPKKETTINPILLSILTGIIVYNLK